jgi:hypothetical protein
MAEVVSRWYDVDADHAFDGGIVSNLTRETAAEI